MAVFTAQRNELRRFLNARMGNESDADDLIQELWIKLQSLNIPPVANPRAYLYRMAQNLAADRIRMRHRQMQRDRAWTDERTGYAAPGIEAADDNANAEEEIHAREEAAQLASAIANLPEGARRAFMMHKIDGLSHADVAAALGISKSGVEKHMAVAMKYLRRALLD